MNIQDAYFYLKKYGGWDYLNERWRALHAENPFWTARDLHEFCYQNGDLRRGSITEAVSGLPELTCRKAESNLISGKAFMLPAFARRPKFGRREQAGFIKQMGQFRDLSFTKTLLSIST
jgi:hypothetical protein